MAYTDITQAIRAFQGGDQAAFQSIYDGSSRYIYYTILKSVQNRDIADDILQETYIEIYRYLPSLKEAEAFKGWASVIAQNKISRYFRKKSDAVFSSEEEMEQVFGSIEEEDIAVLPEDAADNRETQRLIMEIIDRLPDVQREAVVSYYYNQLSIPEIARAMEVPENTVKTWLSRGKKKIKQDVIELAEKHGTKLYSVPFIAVLFGFFSQEAEACALPAGAFYQIGVRLSEGIYNMASSSGTAGVPAGIQSVAGGAQDGVAGMMAQHGAGIQSVAGGVQAGVAGAAGTMGPQAVAAGVAGAAVKAAGIKWGLVAAIVAIVAALGTGTVVGVRMVQSYLEEKELEERQAREKRDRDKAEDEEDEKRDKGAVIEEEIDSKESDEGEIDEIATDNLSANDDSVVSDSEDKSYLTLNFFVQKNLRGDALISITDLNNGKDYNYSTDFINHYTTSIELEPGRYLIHDAGLSINDRVEYTARYLDECEFNIEPGETKLMDLIIGDITETRINPEDKRRLEEKGAFEEESSVYEVPEVIKKLEKHTRSWQGVEENYYSIGENELQSVWSEGSIVDKGEYYEIENAVLMFWTFDEEYDEEGVSDLEFAPVTIRIRKNASVDIWSGERITMSAEELFQKDGKLYFDPDGYDKKTMLCSAGEGTVFDEEGYLVKFTGFPFG